MPSLDDVYNQLQQINTNLAAVHNDGLATKAAVDTDTAAVNNVRNSVDQAVQQLKQLVAGQFYTNTALYQLTHQADTMICILEHISRNTCSILNENSIQTGLQRKIAGDIHGILEIEQTAQPGAALEIARLQALQAEVERCCPPPPQKVPCEYAPCPTPPTRLEPPRPVDDRKPIG